MISSVDIAAQARPPAVILAGGLSRRMFANKTEGGSSPIADKGLLSLGPDTMLDRVIVRLAPQVGATVLNANGDAARFARYNLPVVADTIDGFVGPLAGVLAGLRWARAKVPAATHVVSVSADAPFLPEDLVQRLCAATSEHPSAIVLARSQGELHPVIGLWPVRHADDLEAALQSGVRKVLAWTDKHGTIPVDFPAVTIGDEEVDPFFNANTPEELAEARRLIGKLVG